MENDDFPLYPLVIKHGVLENGNQWCSIHKTSIQFGDFPASHVWLPEGRYFGERSPHRLDLDSCWLGLRWTWKQVYPSYIILLSGSMFNPQTEEGNLWFLLPIALQYVVFSKNICNCPMHWPIDQASFQLCLLLNPLVAYEIIFPGLSTSFDVSKIGVSGSSSPIKTGLPSGHQHNNGKSPTHGGFNKGFHLYMVHFPASHVWLIKHGNGKWTIYMWFSY